MTYEDSNITFIRNLSDNGKLFFLNNPAGVPYAVICVNGQKLWGTELKRVDFMIRDWEKSHGKMEPTKEELERYIIFKSGYYTQMMKKGEAKLYLKLGSGFFNDKLVKALSNRYGDTGTTIYLKMMLKSLSHDCRMRFEGVADTLQEEIALDIECNNIQQINDILSFLEKHKLLVKENDDVYYFPQAESLIGVEEEEC